MGEEEKLSGTETFSTDGISAAVSKLLEHPELISMVASALGADKASDGEKQSETSETQNDGAQSVAAGAFTDGKPTPELLTSLMPMIAKLAGGGGSCPHEPLLCALKPYLNPSRREAIDYIIKISKMSSLVKEFK